MTDIKDRLIEKIRNCQDEEFLNEICSLFEKNDKEILKINCRTKKSIENAKEQLKKGESFTQEEIEKQFDQWLTI